MFAKRQNISGRECVIFTRRNNRNLFDVAVTCEGNTWQAFDCSSREDAERRGAMLAENSRPGVRARAERVPLPAVQPIM
jgi:hypothetical protein